MDTKIIHTGPSSILNPKGVCSEQASVGTRGPGGNHPESPPNIVLQDMTKYLVMDPFY